MGSIEDGPVWPAGWSLFDDNIAGFWLFGLESNGSVCDKEHAIYFLILFLIAEIRDFPCKV